MRGWPAAATNEITRSTKIHTQSRARLNKEIHHVAKQMQDTISTYAN